MHEPRVSGIYLPKGIGRGEVAEVETEKGRVLKETARVSDWENEKWWFSDWEAIVGAPSMSAAMADLERDGEKWTRYVVCVRWSPGQEPVNETYEEVLWAKG